MSGNRGCPEGFDLRPGPGAAHPLLEAYARIDELAAERDEALARVSDLEDRIARVRDRHNARPHSFAPVLVCDACEGEDAPCLTARLLDGEECPDA